MHLVDERAARRVWETIYRQIQIFDQTFQWLYCLEGHQRLWDEESLLVAVLGSHPVAPL